MNANSPLVLRAKTPSFAHHGIAFSPFFEDRIAVASGANFGLVGNGRVHVFALGPGGLTLGKWFDTQDCVYDVAWSECHESQVMAACGNGSLRLFDLNLEGLPVKKWHEHSAEVMSVEWNNLQKDSFVTASWDQTVKIWNVEKVTSLLTLPAHQGQIYRASWCPNVPSTIATTGADGFIHGFDLRTPTPSRPIWSIRAGESDVLDLDWNKYEPTLIASAGKDGGIRVWDIRSGGRGPLVELKGHRLAVRKVAWSPHHRDILASTSYDMTCRTWSTSPPAERNAHSQHSEFVMGTAWALFDEGLLASCAWDQEVHLYRG